MIDSVRSLITTGTPAGNGAADEKVGSWPGAATAVAFAEAVESGRLNLPLPGGGRTRERWAVLADLAGEDPEQVLQRSGRGGTAPTMSAASQAATTPLMAMISTDTCSVIILTRSPVECSRS